MVANPKQALHQLVDRLSDEAAATLLVDARRLTSQRPGHELPTLHTASPIASIDDLRGDAFPPEEDVEEFDATIRRWREAGTARRGRS